MEFSEFKLWSEDQLLESININEVKDFVKKETTFWKNNDSSKIAKEWLSWCKRVQQMSKNVKIMEYDIPTFVAPPNINISLNDIKVFSKGPDDKLYNERQDLRENVARGNTILYIHNQETNVMHYDGVVFALRKFTGGLGDEDEDQPESNKTWLNYFIQPIDTASEIICTEKANGEAAHLSARYIGNRFYLVLGSKNVHMIISKISDLDQYKDGRFLVARQVGEATLNMLSKLSKENVELLLNFLHHTKSTAVFEVLQPGYQHVVDLDYLKGESLLKFIAWTSAYKQENKIESFCSIRPDKAIDFARLIGMETVNYHIIPTSKVEDEMNKIRRGYNTEGSVMYFVDGHKGNVIGLLKKKTAWYILARAIREKASAAVVSFVKDKSEPPSKRTKKCENRLREIQKWLDLPESYLLQWIKLSDGFMKWLHVEVHEGKIEKCRGNFPQLWKQYLSQTNQSDIIEWV